MKKNTALRLFTFFYIFTQAQFCWAEPFSIAVIPDTQRYTQKEPETLMKQIKWLVKNKKKKNIQFVIFLGDITQNNTIEEWQNADQAISLLDDTLPYSLVPGNHDMGPNGWGENRDTQHLNTFFSPKRFMNKKWYGGTKSGTNDNSYCFFNTSGIKFMIVNLEFGPRDATLHWANQLIGKHPQKQVIVVTHSYLYSDNKRISSQNGHLFTPHNYGVGKKEHAADGEEIWNKLIKNHKNIFLVLSGHISESGGTGQLTSKGINKNDVHQLLIDYTAIGQGWFRLLKFVPEENKIISQPISPGKIPPDLKDNKIILLDKNPRHGFELNYDMQTITPTD